MRVMSLGVLSFQFLLFSLVGSEPKEDNKLTNKLIYIDQDTTPKLFYLSFIEFGNLPRGYAYLDAENEIHSVVSSEQDVKKKYRISSIFCSSVDQFLLENEFDQVRLSLGSYSFLEDKNDEINRFVDDFELLEEKSLLSFKKFIHQQVSSESSKRNEKPASFDLSLTLILLGVVLLVLFSIYKTPNIMARSKRLRVIAIRKKWIKNLYSTGKIDHSLMTKLHKRIDYLPEIITSTAFSHLDLSIFGADPELEKALRRRKRGESVSYKRVQEIYGEADAKASAIYAKAYDSSPASAEFYQLFWQPPLLLRNENVRQFADVR